MPLDKKLVFLQKSNNKRMHDDNNNLSIILVSKT